MTNLRAVIIDDEPHGVKSLSLVIREFIKDVKVVAATISARKGIELIENYKPDIVFLDINMPDLDGFGLLDWLTWKNFSLVFVTAHQEYALKALKRNAVDYLLKPVDYNELQLTVARIKTHLAQQEHASLNSYLNLFHELNQTAAKKQKIFINLKSRVEPVNLDEILYLESRSNYTNIYLVDERSIVASKNLKDFEALLCTSYPNFMRVHHSFIINKNKVLRYLKPGEVIVMTNGANIPLSKSRREVFYEWLNL